MFGKSRANFSWDDLWCNPPNPTPRKKLRLLARSCSARLCARPSTDFSVMGLFDCWLISSSLKAWRSLVFSYKDVFFVISDGIVFLKVQCIFIYEGQVQVWCVVYSVRNKCKRHMIEDMSFLVCDTWWFMTKELGPIFYECKQVVFSTGKVNFFLNDVTGRQWKRSWRGRCSCYGSCRPAYKRPPLIEIRCFTSHWLLMTRNIHQFGCIQQSGSLPSTRQTAVHISSHVACQRVQLVFALLFVCFFLEKMSQGSTNDCFLVKITMKHLQ